MVNRSFFLDNESGLTSILPVSILGPLIFLFGLLLIGIGQNRSINSIQKALVPEKNTFLVDALRVKSKLNRGPKYCCYWRRNRIINFIERFKKL